MKQQKDAKNPICIQFDLCHLQFANIVHNCNCFAIILLWLSKSIVAITSEQTAKKTKVHLQRKFMELVQQKEWEIVGTLSARLDGVDSLNVSAVGFSFFADDCPFCRFLCVWTIKKGK